jgi:bifunctional NMN adenylyltransferase/nudix hydrolase
MMGTEIMSDSAARATDVAVLIGRFQPFHLGHAALLERALEVAPRAVIVLGSARSARQAKNPFNAAERQAMIEACLSPALRERVSFAMVRDYYNEPRWASAVEAAVERASGGGRVTLVGFHKDASSAYLNLFPGWQRALVPRQAPIDATELRRLYYRGDAELPAELTAALPAAIVPHLERFRRSAAFEALRAEAAALEESRRTWGKGPFVTLDAVVTVAGHVLLVERGRGPGKGLWALPGGFLDGSERLLQGALRELREETELGCSESQLRGALKSVVVFDHPDRSQRGRTITHAHYFALDLPELPAVNGADDAAAARWFAVEDLPSAMEQLFEDHFQILDHFLNLTQD